MKKVVLALVLVFFSVFFGFSQTNSKLVLKENIPTIPSTETNKSNDISVEDWNILESALQIEDWNKTLVLAEKYQQSLKTETKDKKKARLRYIYLYALAGKVISYSALGDREQEEYAQTRLSVAAKSFVGREFILPVRKVLYDCKDVLNYVCESETNPGYLHVSATNPNGTTILFSEYVEMRVLKLDTRKHDKADVILGGILKGVRLNTENISKLVMTLQFEDGFVHRIFVNETK